MTDPNLTAQTVPATNRALDASQTTLRKLDKQIAKAETDLRTLPAKLPANAEHWLAHQLNAYLQDDDEYRAITRNLLHQGGTITYRTHEITVALDRPHTPKIARCLNLLTEQLNTHPAHLPGDSRPITYTIT